MHRLIAVVVVSAACAGCIADRGGSANAVGDHVRSMPGVARSEARYDSSFDGGENFDLTVDLRPDATDEQVRDIAGYFAKEAPARKLSEQNARLELRLAKATASPYASGYQHAEIGMGPFYAAKDPTSDESGARAVAWLRAARDPWVVDSNLTETVLDGTDAPFRLILTMSSEASQSRALALQASDPLFAEASWRISLPTTGESPPHDFDATPTPPTDDEVRIWHQISDLVGPYRTASAQTTVPRARGAQTDTVVRIDLRTGPDAATDDLRIAWAVAQAITGFGRPVSMDADGPRGRAELIVGGCERHDAAHVASPMERALAHQFERC